jgi:hypothetical protein
LKFLNSFNPAAAAQLHQHQRRSSGCCLHAATRHTKRGTTCRATALEQQAFTPRNSSRDPPVITHSQFPQPCSCAYPALPSPTPTLLLVLQHTTSHSYHIVTSLQHHIHMHKHNTTYACRNGTMLETSWLSGAARTQAA